MTAFVDELELLLAETPDHAEQRASDTFATLAGPQADSLVFFGAGNLGRTIVRKLRQIGIRPLAFADNNPKSWNTTIEGLPVLSPVDAARRFGLSAAFVITIWNAAQTHRTRDLRRQLADLGCRTVIPFAFLFWQHPDAFLPYLCIDVPQKVLLQAGAVRQAFACLADDLSRRHFIANLRFRLHLDFDALPDPSADPQYWPTDIDGFHGGSHFVDCGAFDGDSIAEIAGHPRDVRKITAFEPDPANFARLQAYVASLQNPALEITLHQAAVGAHAGTIHFDAAANAASRVSESGIEVPCLRLDDVLAQAAPSYIKMDVEGAELDALGGAQAVVSRQHPQLAICAYHLQDHLWQVPLHVQSAWPEYRCFLRAHNREGFDLVCYAVAPH